MDIHTIGCTIEPLSLGIFKKVCWHGKFVFILVLPSWSVRQKWRWTILRTTYIQKRCSRCGTISTSTILSHTMTELSLVCIFVIRNLLHNFILLDALKLVNQNKEKYSFVRWPQNCIEWYNPCVPGTFPLTYNLINSDELVRFIYSL